jgi:hypothetical protein
MSITPQALQDLLDELEASRVSRKRAWEILQEIRWVLKDVTGTELPSPARKTIDLEGRLVKDGVRKVLRDRQNALTDLVSAIRDYRNYFGSTANVKRLRLRPRGSGTEQGDRSGGRVTRITY